MCTAFSVRAQVTVSGAGFGLNGTYTFSTDNCTTDDLFLNGLHQIRYNCTSRWEIAESGTTVRYVSNNGTSSDIPPSFGWVTEPGGAPAGITLTGDVFPVTLAYFSARNVAEGILLSWETLNELNNSHFLIERSLDAKLWQVQGNGTTDEISAYQFVDSAPLAGVSYYRLKQVDLNGTFDYSNIIEVSAGPLPFRVFPNPVQDAVSIQFNGEGVSKVAILNMQGQVVKEWTTDASSMQLPLGALPTGMYQLRIMRNQSQVFRQTLVKL